MPVQVQSRDEYCSMRRRIFYLKTDVELPDDRLRELARQSDAAAGLTPEHLAAAARSALGAPALAIETLTEQGTFHRLYRVTAAPNERFILRANAAASCMVDYALEVEAWAGAESLADGIPTPRVLHLDTSRRVCPFEFMLVAEAPPATLRDYDDQEEIIQARLRDLGGLVARLHTRARHGYGPPDVRTLAEPGQARGLHSTWRAYILLNLEQHVAAGESIGAIDAQLARRIRDLFDSLDPLLEIGHAALLHGDLGNHNVLTDGAGVTGLLDWEDCLLGDPSYDIAFWATFHPERRHAAFFSGYQGVRALPQDFGMRFWLYFLRVALAKTVHRHRFGYQDRPGREPAARRIQLACRRLERDAR